MTLFEAKWRYTNWDEDAYEFGDAVTFRCYVYAETLEEAERLAEKEFKMLVGVPDMVFGESVLSVLNSFVVLSELM